MPFVITDEQVASTLTWDLSLESARDVFREQAAGRVLLTDPRVKKLSFPGAGGGYRVKGAVLTGMGVAGLRAARTVILSSWPEMEFIGAVEERTGYARRVGAVTAVALEALDRETFSSVCLFGAGRLARTTLGALAHRYRLGQVTVLSRRLETREKLAAQFRLRGLNVCPGADPEAAVRQADLIITMTSADEVLVRDEWVGESAVVVSTGGGQELDFALLERAGGLYVDDLEGCLESGDLSRAREAGCYRREWVDGTLAGLLCDPGAGVQGGPIVFIPRGMAAMDVLQAYRVALQLL
ncbi:MAG: hypothetical protein R6U70_03855 [Bacillota bacterium]